MTGRRPPPTARQLEVLDVLSRGLTGQQAARRLGVSPNTIRSHLTGVLWRLDARNTAHAVRRALELGLIGDGRRRHASGDDVG